MYADCGLPGTLAALPTRSARPFCITTTSLAMVSKGRFAQPTRITATLYLGMILSLVINVSGSSIAWATNKRSNGSL